MEPVIGTPQFLASIEDTVLTDSRTLIFPAKPAEDFERRAAASDRDLT
jgi:hypothetical protein